MSLVSHSHKHSVFVCFIFQLKHHTTPSAFTISSLWYNASLSASTQLMWELNYVSFRTYVGWKLIIFTSLHWQAWESGIHRVINLMLYIVQCAVLETFQLKSQIVLYTIKNQSHHRRMMERRTFHFDLQRQRCEIENTPQVGTLESVYIMVWNDDDDVFTIDFMHICKANKDKKQLQ